MNHDVFISYYQSIDKDAAKTICNTLEQNGIKYWAPRDIPSGTSYDDEIGKALDSCKVVLVLFSEASSRSKWIMNEVYCVFEE